MDSVPLTDLKARLAWFIDRVRQGEELVVTDRGRPVARIAPIRSPEQDGGRLQELLRTGRLRAPGDPVPPDFFSVAGPPDASGRSLATLLDERADRL